MAGWLQEKAAALPISGQASHRTPIGEYKAEHSICFLFAYMLICLSRFSTVQRVQSSEQCLKLTRQPKTKFEGTAERQKRDGAMMNRVVSSTLRYVPGRRAARLRRRALRTLVNGRCTFPVRNPSHRPRRPSFLLSSTEV
jgi:hypothetical protein